MGQNIYVQEICHEEILSQSSLWEMESITACFLSPPPPRPFFFFFLNTHTHIYIHMFVVTKIFYELLSKWV